MIQSNKFIYFIIGTIVGIAIGASVVWWMQNYDFKIWFTFSGKNKKEINTTADNTATNDSDSEKSKAYSGVNKTTSVKKDASLNAYYSDTNTTSYQNNEYSEDTARNVSNSNSSDDIVIAKDELLFTRIIKVEGINGSDSKKEAALDSLLINDKTKKPPANFIKVEFWRSPINYKGYKYSNNKLVLFGIYIYEDASLEMRNNKLYLNYANTFYLIEKADDFQPLMAVRLPKNK